MNWRYKHRIEWIMVVVGLIWIEDENNSWLFDFDMIRYYIILEFFIMK